MILQKIIGFLMLLVFFGESYAQESTDEELLQDEELQQSSLEIIEAQPSMIVLGLGAYDAWQRIGIGYQHCQTLLLCWRAAMGGGRFVSNLNSDEIAYEMTIDARTLALSLRSFLPLGLPLYSQTGLGWSWWSLDSVPRDATEEDAIDRLRFSGQSQAFFLTQQFGFQIAWVSGWRLEMSLVGFSRAKMSSLSLTTSSSKSRQAAYKIDDSQHAWGILNFGVGYSL